MANLKMSNVMVALFIFATMTVLSSMIYTGLQDYYDFEKTDTQDNKDVMDSLNDINIIEGMESIVTALNVIGSPTASKTDILGGLAAASIGFLKTATGLVTFPIEIMGVLTGFYTIPSPVSTLVGLVVIVYIGFVLINNSTGKDN